MQYASHAYRNALTGAGIAASMSRKADCYDNAPMESFEDRTRSSSQLQTRVEARRDIFAFTEGFYN